MRRLDDVSEKLFEIPSALISLDDPDKVRSQEGDRIYAAISISDYSGSTSGAMIQEPAPILSGAADMKH